MKTTKLLAVFILTLVFIYAFTGCGKKEAEVKDDKQKTEQKQDTQNKPDTTKLVKDGKYFCVMHPLEQSNEPAKCPVCKMNMVSKKDYNNEMSEKHEEMESKHAAMKNFLHFEIQLSKLKTSDCENTIKKAFKDNPGIMDYFIDILESRVHMYIDKSKTTKKDVEKVISDLGYDANETKANPDALTKLPADCK
jgi:copper chaperone CopZ